MRAGAASEMGALSSVFLREPLAVAVMDPTDRNDAPHGLRLRHLDVIGVAGGPAAD